MAYTVKITEIAESQFSALSARKQRVLESAIMSRLREQPTVPTKAIRRLRANPFAEFELRAGDLRALYNVENDEVVILVVGQKVGNKLIVEGEEFHAHEDDVAEPSGGAPEPDAD